MGLINCSMLELVCFMKENEHFALSHFRQNFEF